jgi:predicted DNA-binding protein
MKKIPLPSICIFLLFFISCTFLNLPASTAQDFKNPGEYMTYISKAENDVAQKYLSYLSSVAHDKSVRKSESRRTRLLDACWDTRNKVSAMPVFEGDKTLKEASVKYLEILYRVLNEDYGKLVNMEEIAEQSYDNMEAYLMAQDKAEEKLNEAGTRKDSTAMDFAKKHNVTVIDQKDEFSQKMEEASRVNGYYNTLYLIFFKSYKQDIYLTDAVNTRNINNIEQNRNALLGFSKDGLAALDTTSAFENDRSLINACRKLLQFYNKESSDRISDVVDYYMKDESFQQIKKEFEKKSSAQKTKDEVDKYNKMVNELNSAGKVFNKTQQELNSSRGTLLDDWNNAVQSFLDGHVPFYN